MRHIVQTLRRRLSDRPSPVELRISRGRRLDLVGEGVLVGIAGGLTIALYRFALSSAERILRWATSALWAQGIAYAGWLVMLVLLCLAVGRLMLFEPYTQGSGIPQVDAEVAGRIDMPWRRVLPVKFLEGTLCALAGLSLGREGPSVQLGSMAGKAVSLLCGNDRSKERLMVTCGAAAGMSAAFHAPLTGVLFAVEEIHREFSASLVISVMTASIAADFVSSQVLGVTPLIHFVQFSSIPHRLYLSVLLMGVFCGLVGWVHNRGMFCVQERCFGRISKLAPYSRLAIPFALAGVAAVLFPDLMCGGDAIIERVLEARQETVTALLLLLVGKYLFTTICFGSGAPGGTLFPLVVMGSLVGAIYGAWAMRLADISGLYENSFIVLGMAGIFSAVIQAPVTAVVLVFELTGSLEALLATSTVSIVAYVVSTLLGTEPFYEHLYARLMGDADEEMAQGAAGGEKIVRSFNVSPGSRLEERCIRDVAWPEGTLVVTVRRAGQDIIAKGDTRMRGLDEIYVLMNATTEEHTKAQIRALCDNRW